MEPTQTLPHNSPLTSPNAFKRTVKFDQRKTLLNKTQHGPAKIYQRRASDKQKPVLQPIMMFEKDPLQLLPLVDRKPGTDSPELVSTPKSLSNPMLSEPVNTSDPLNLEDVGILSCKFGRKRKKKRHRSFSFTHDDSSTLNSSDSKIFDDKLPLVSPTEIAPKVLKPNSSSPTNNLTAVPRKGVFNIGKSELNRETIVKQKIRNHTHGSHIYMKISELEYKPLGNIYTIPISTDQRVQNFKLDWFKNKQCLDIGCGEGYITHWISKYFHPSSVTGVDIDSGLINIAKNKDRELLNNIHSSSSGNISSFPKSLPMVHGSISTGFKTGQKSISSFDKKISFVCENYVPVNADSLKQIEPKYDVIVFLSTSKWIQLNHGDGGLRRTFKKIFLQLKPEGKLIFEPQTFNCYKKSKNLTPEVRRNFDLMTLMPNDFIRYLLSSEIGFTQSLCLAHTRKKKTSNARPLYLLTKGGVTSQQPTD